MSIKRFAEIFGVDDTVIKEHPNGLYVRYDDHAQEIAALRNELTAARLELNPLRRQNERLAAALLRHGCYCGRQGPDLILHATWCPYRKACTPYPKADPTK